MPVYIYETVPTDPTEPPRRFEAKQSMKDAALTHEPQTGQPVRRLIQGGHLNIRRATRSPGSPKPSASYAGRASCCGVNGCSTHRLLR